MIARAGTLLVAALAAGIVACAGTDAVAPRPDPTPTPPPPPPAAPTVARIVVDSSSASLKWGDTLTVRAIAVDSGGNAIPGTVLSWTSSAPGVVSVSTLGTLSAKQPGSATITVSSGTISTTVSTNVSTGWRAVYASAWWLNTCALRSDSTAFCWGANGSGQTGTGLPDSIVSRPTQVAGSVKFTQLALMSGATCALGSDGAAYCWGANTYGQLGDGTKTARPTPVPVQTQVRFVALTAGLEHVCGLTATGAAYCWGDASEGQLGAPAPTDVSTTPIQVQSSQPFTALAAGGAHTCGLVAGGSVYCWGWNQNGQLGSARGSAAYWQPAPAAPGLQFVSIAGSYGSTCGVLADGRLACWGSNTIGTFYQTTGPGPQVVELAPLGLTTVVSSAWDPCVLSAQGGATCWGIASSAPEDIPLTVKIVSIAVGERHTCVVTSRRDLFCLGDNSQGQLGTGSVGGASATPARVAEPQAQTGGAG